MLSDNSFDHINYFSSLSALKNFLSSDFVDSVIVYTYGAWDLLHPGHIRFLSRAKKLGDFLIVGVISDNQISEFKGKERPVQRQDERIITVGSLKIVDAVIHQPIYDPSNELEELSMVDILTKGDDWEYIPGTETIERLGGRLVKLGYSSDFSTSKLVEKITN